MRSDRAHAAIASIDTDTARTAPGVLGVLTGADAAAAGYNRGRAMVPYKGRGEAVRSPDSPALAHGRVRYVGEPIAIVVAETAHQAQDAAELIAIEFHQLPAVVDGRMALEPRAPLLHDGVPGNLCFDFDYGDPAATEAAFAGAAHVVRLEQESSRVVGNPMEPKAALAEWDGEILELWSASQGMTGMRDGLAALTGLRPDQLRVHARDVGGAFGIRGAAYPEYAALALAALQVGRPVKWGGPAGRKNLPSAIITAARFWMSRGNWRWMPRGGFLAIRHDWVLQTSAAHPSGPPGPAPTR